ncbi:MAG: hypothetical protein DI566_12515 [Microbacterium sp.]|nr:MAG: hypothetical protein DI566_12515 [Microbacterium sp.]
MQFASFGRFVFIAQWILAVLLPIWVVIGRGLVGAPLGWWVVFGAIYGIAFVIGLLVPPVIALFDSPARQRATVRTGYAVSMIAVWVPMFLSGLAVPDGGDDGVVGSALTNWTGMSDDTSMIIFLLCGAIAFVAWLAALVFAIASIVRGSKESAPQVPAAYSPPPPAARF